MTFVKFFKKVALATLLPLAFIPAIAQDLPTGELNVSASLTEMTGSAAASNAFMRMTLQNCGTNMPFVPGAATLLPYPKASQADSGHQPNQAVPRDCLRQQPGCRR
jgi:hypothetical protein